MNYSRLTTITNLPVVSLSYSSELLSSFWMGLEYFCTVELFSESFDFMDLILRPKRVKWSELELLLLGETWQFKVFLVLNKGFAGFKGSSAILGF